MINKLVQYNRNNEVRGMGAVVGTATYSDIVQTDITVIEMVSVPAGAIVTGVYVDVIEEFVRTEIPGETPDWLDNPKLIDLYYSSFVLVYAGQYEQALDLIERRSTSNIPYSAVFYLRSVLFQEKADSYLLRTCGQANAPNYRKLVPPVRKIRNSFLSLFGSQFS